MLTSPKRRASTSLPRRRTAYEPVESTEHVIASILEREARSDRQIPSDRRDEHLSSAAAAATRLASWTETPTTSSPTHSISRYGPRPGSTLHPRAPNRPSSWRSGPHARHRRRRRGTRLRSLDLAAWNVETMSRIRALCAPDRSICSHRGDSWPVESTMSVTTIVARTRSLSDSSGSSQPRTPLHSIETTGSSPTTHASWPARRR